MGDWKEYSILDFAEIHNQSRVPLSKMQRAKKQGIYPYYGASGIIDFVDGYLFDGEFVLISEDGENLKSRQTPIAFKTNGQFWVNNHAHILKGHKPFHHDLMIYYFQNMDLNPYITGAVQPKLNKANLLSIPIHLPENESEQKAIASLLSSLDDKIDLLHRQNKTLEAMAETLFRQWFVEEAQEDWEEVPLGAIATVQNGYTFSSRDYVEHQIDHLEVFKMGHIEPGGGLRYSPKTDFVPRAEKLKKWILSEGDIVMAMTDMKDSMGILGHPAMIDKSDTYVLNQRVARIYLNSNESLINNHFLYLQLKTDVAIAIIQSKAHGGVQVNLSTEAIRSTPIIVPPEPDQEKGFKLLEGYLLKSQNNRKQIRILEKLRDTLLPKLMSGEVRIQYNKETTA